MTYMPVVLGHSCNQYKKWYKPVTISQTTTPLQKSPPVSSPALSTPYPLSHLSLPIQLRSHRRVANARFTGFHPSGKAM
jgi:hypothetical protein